MKVLLDTNIALDVLLAREPFKVESEAIWASCDSGEIEGFLSAISLTTVFYVMRKAVGPKLALHGVETCLNAFTIVRADGQILKLALAMTGPDFEDNVQIASAVEANAERIITRNAADFAASPVTTLTPAAFLLKSEIKPQP